MGICRVEDGRLVERWGELYKNDMFLPLLYFSQIWESQNLKTLCAAHYCRGELAWGWVMQREITGN